MADYTPILDTQTDPDAPLTSDLAKAWAENPPAIAEGANGAPKVMAAALGDVYRGVVTIPRLGGTVDVIGLARTEIVTLDGVTANNGGTGVLRIAYTTDGGSTWSAFTNMAGTPSAVNQSFGMSINIVTGAFTGFNNSTGQLFSGTVTPPAGANGIRLSGAAATGAGPWGYAHIKALKGVAP